MEMTNQPTEVIRVGHSPDPDDAFMFYALAEGKIATGRYRFVHQLSDIETLNRRAVQGDLELTAVSLHAYAYLEGKYVLCTCGASMGDGYGPMVIARHSQAGERLAEQTIAVPGTWTTAFLVLSLYLRQRFRYVVVPFDRILDAVAQGSYQDQAIDAGLIIHEGQLTYSDYGLCLLVDLGQWWNEETGLPLPLGANALRKDLGERTVREVNHLLRMSIDYGLEHRQEALRYALQFGRGLDCQRADRFVSMYVNHWTKDFGPVGRQAVAELLQRGYQQGVIPHRVTPQFVE